VILSFNHPLAIAMEVSRGVSGSFVRSFDFSDLLFVGFCGLSSWKWFLTFDLIFKSIKLG
jgi:hypothetical protein